MFICVCAAIGEEHVVHALWGSLGNEPRCFGAWCRHMGWCNRGDRGSLFLNRCHDFRVLVTNIGVDHLRGEIDVALTGLIPEEGTLSFHHGHRAKRVLGSPGVKNVLTVQLISALAFGPQRIGDIRSMRNSHDSPYWFCGKPRLMPPCDGSDHRVVTALPRVKKCTPSAPWAWVSPNSEFFQPPKE